MRIIDRYILKKIATPVLFCVYTFILLYLIGDLFDHLSEITRNKVPFLSVLKYYALLVPFGFVQTISWATVLGTIYVFSQFTKHNELTAMKSSGIEILSIATPFIFLGFCISIITFVVSDRVVPTTFQNAESLKTEYMNISATKKQVDRRVKNIAFLTEGMQIYVKSLDTTNNSISDIRIHYVSKNYNIVRRIVAESATWRGDQWNFTNVSIYELGPEKKIIGEPIFYPTYALEDLTITPEDLIRAASDAQVQSIRDVKSSIAQLKKNNLDYTTELVEVHEKMATPWSNLTLILLIIPFLAKTRVRQGFALTIIGCLGLAFAFHMLNAIVIAMGKAGTIPPFLSTWSLHIIVIIASFFLMKRANY